MKEWKVWGDTVRKIHIMSGCPASGKSTLIKSNALSDMVLSRDAWRKTHRGGKYSPKEREAWHAYINGYLASLKSDIWIDQTTIGMSALKSLLEALKITPDDEIIIHVLNTPLEICLERNAKRPAGEIVPKKQLMHMYDNHIKNKITAKGIINMRLPCSVTLRTYKG